MKTLIVNISTDTGLTATFKVHKAQGCTSSAFKKDWERSLTKASKNPEWNVGDVKRNMKNLGWMFKDTKSQETVEVFY
ncbi:MAG: hypothetical protein M0R32_02510 [Candidatus Cloacimonetes bacterium]|jgi:hypothetical protein|nr:hypothetical protein [Candidatus Cloacimonadota bacterium]